MVVWWLCRVRCFLTCVPFCGVSERHDELEGQGTQFLPGSIFMSKKLQKETGKISQLLLSSPFCLTYLRISFDGSSSLLQLNMETMNLKIHFLIMSRCNCLLDRTWFQFSGLWKPGKPPLLHHEILDCSNCIQGGFL